MCWIYHQGGYWCDPAALRGGARDYLPHFGEYLVEVKCSSFPDANPENAADFNATTLIQ